MSERNDQDLHIAALAPAEIHRGVLEKPPGKRRDQLETWFGGPEGPPALFAGRVLSFDDKSSRICVRLMAEGTAKGRPRSAFGVIIAAVAEPDRRVVVTDNEADFVRVETVNPCRNLWR